LIKACTKASSAKDAHPRFAYQLARLFFIDGIGGIALKEKAADLAIRSYADKGWPDAQAMQALDLLYFGSNRVGTTPERVEAIRAGLKSAAEAGHIQAMGVYAFALALPQSDLVDRRDVVESARFLSLVAQGAPETKPGDDGDYIAKQRYSAVLMRARLISNNPEFTQAEKLAAFETFKRLAAAGDIDAKLSYATSLEKGRSTKPDPVLARQLYAELATSSEDAKTRSVASIALASLSRMLISGKGGPADPVKARALIEDGLARKLPNGSELSTILASLMIDGKHFPREPRAALRLLEENLYGLEGQLLLVRLIEMSGYATSKADDLLSRLLAEAKGSGGKEAAMALGRLAAARVHPFATSAEIRSALAPYAKDDLDARLLLARLTMHNLGSTSFKVFVDPASPLDEPKILAVIEEGVKAGKPAALVTKALMLRDGALLPQDDRGASKALIAAAKSNDPEALTLLGKAYDDGLGVKRNNAEAAKAWRAAAKQNYLAAREAIASGATFNTEITLRESMIETIALYANGEGFRFGSSIIPSGTMLAGTFTSIRSLNADASELAAIFMEAMRYAPAALDDKLLVPLAKAQMDEVRVAIEKKLKAEGFYDGDVEGFFDPSVRDALRAYVKAKGPLPSLYE
jgi:TPR repeat protein